jgi:hypothetical protein
MKRAATIIAKLYVAQALAGFTIGLTVPWLHFFKVLQ